MVWPIFSTMLLIAFGVLVALQSRAQTRIVEELLQRIDALQADNRALTEALVRVEGKPFVFRKPDKLEDAEGWFDAKVTHESNREV